MRGSSLALTAGITSYYSTCHDHRQFIFVAEHAFLLTFSASCLDLPLQLVLSAVDALPRNIVEIARKSISCMPEKLIVGHSCKHQGWLIFFALERSCLSFWAVFPEGLHAME
jgi:hypothetical protein